MKRALIVIVGLQFCVVSLSAQIQRTRADDYNLPVKTYKGDFNNESSYSSSYPSYIGYECISFITDTTKYGRIKFSSVTAYDYRSNDSLPGHKKLVHKCLMRFNKDGQMIYECVTDSNGKVTDSVRMRYDMSDKQSSDVEFSNTYDTTGIVEKVYAQYYAYDKNVHVIKDSVWEKRKIGYSEESNKDPRSTMFYTYLTYDNIGNLLSMISISTPRHSYDGPSDTTRYTYRYDHKLLIEEDRYGSYYDFFKSLYKYDNAGKLTEKMDIEGYDTNVERYVYDEDHRKILEEEYNKGKLECRIKTEKLPEGGWRITEEKFSINQRTSCPSNFKYITIFDADSNELSEIITSDKDNKATVDKELHKYTFRGKLMLSDSLTKTSEGEFSVCTSLDVAYNSYDAVGNKTEHQMDGYDRNFVKELWLYNQRNKVVSYQYYLSCGSTPYETDTYVYYPDNVTLKEHAHNGFIALFGEDTRILKFIYAGEEYHETDYEYQK